MKRKRDSSIDDSAGDTPSGDQVSEKPASLIKRVSPPPLTRRKAIQDKSATAAVEAGEKHVEDHLEFYSQHLLAVTQLDTGQSPRLSHAAWVDLYTRNAGNEKGHHFVVHQHDHPIAGTHYDLRLQCNASSSISFAIMYGLPGDPNSRRLNRNATETRVHCLWNHLIETASHSTGTMLLWDTGEYEVLPYYEQKRVEMTDESGSSDDCSQPSKVVSEPQKLREGFSRRKVRLRFHGSKLPKGYTISLRLTKDNYRTEQPKKPLKRRRRMPFNPTKQTVESSGSEASSGSDEVKLPPETNHPSLLHTAAPPPSQRLTNDNAGSHAEDLAVASEDENESIRLNNAYPGAINDIGSVHQRRWYLSLDRRGSGFIKKTTKNRLGETSTVWLPKSTLYPASHHHVSTDLPPQGFERFWVQGRDVERSVVTGRLAQDILADEGVEGYVPRGLWRAVTE